MCVYIHVKYMHIYMPISVDRNDFLTMQEMLECWAQTSMEKYFPTRASVTWTVMQRGLGNFAFHLILLPGLLLGLCTKWFLSSGWTLPPPLFSPFCCC